MIIEKRISSRHP